MKVRTILKSLTSVALIMTSIVGNAYELFPDAQLNERQSKVLDQFLNIAISPTLETEVKWYEDTRKVLIKTYGEEKIETAFDELKTLAETLFEDGNFSVGLSVESQIDKYRELQSYAEVLKSANPQLKDAMKKEMESWIALREYVCSMICEMRYTDIPGAMYGMSVQLKISGLNAVRCQIYCDEVVNIIAGSKYVSTIDVGEVVSSYYSIIESFIEFDLMFDEYDDESGFQIEEKRKVEYAKLLKDLTPIMNRWTEARADVVKAMGGAFTIYNFNTAYLINRLPTPVTSDDY